MARKNLLEAFQKVAETRDEAQRREAAHGSGSAPKAAAGSPAAPSGGPTTAAAAGGNATVPNAAATTAAATTATPTAKASPRAGDTGAVRADNTSSAAPSSSGSSSGSPSGDWLARAAALAAPLRPAPVLAALVAVFVLGFVLGRSGGDEVRADGAGAPGTEDRTGASGALRTPRDPAAADATSAARGPAGTAGAEAQGPKGQQVAVQPTETAYTTPEGQAFDARLRDPANAYTLVAITYNDTAANLELAAELSRHLRGEGFEASDPIRYGTSRKYVVVVGAAATADQLRSTNERLRSTRDPSGRAGSFADAFAVSISSILVR